MTSECFLIREKSIKWRLCMFKLLYCFICRSLGQSLCFLGIAVIKTNNCEQKKNESGGQKGKDALQKRGSSMAIFYHWQQACGLADTPVSQLLYETCFVYEGPPDPRKGKMSRFRQSSLPAGLALGCGFNKCMATALHVSTHEDRCLRIMTDVAQYTSYCRHRSWPFTQFRNVQVGNSYK